MYLPVGTLLERVKATIRCKHLPMEEDEMLFCLLESLYQNVIIFLSIRPLSQNTLIRYLLPMVRQREDGMQHAKQQLYLTA